MQVIFSAIRVFHSSQEPCSVKTPGAPSALPSVDVLVSNESASVDRSPSVYSSPDPYGSLRFLGKKAKNDQGNSIQTSDKQRKALQQFLTQANQADKLAKNAEPLPRVSAPLAYLDNGGRNLKILVLQPSEGTSPPPTAPESNTAKATATACSLQAVAVDAALESRLEESDSRPDEGKTRRKTLKIPLHLGLWIEQHEGRLPTEAYQELDAAYAEASRFLDRCGLHWQVNGKPVTTDAFLTQPEYKNAIGERAVTMMATGGIRSAKNDPQAQAIALAYAANTQLDLTDPSIAASLTGVQRVIAALANKYHLPLTIISGTQESELLFLSATRSQEAHQRAAGKPMGLLCVGSTTSEWVREAFKQPATADAELPENSPQTARLAPANVTLANSAPLLAKTLEVGATRTRLENPLDAEALLADRTHCERMIRDQFTDEDRQGAAESCFFVSNNATTRLWRAIHYLLYQEGFFQKQQKADPNFAADLFEMPVSQALIEKMLSAKGLRRLQSISEDTPLRTLLAKQLYTGYGQSAAEKMLAADWQIFPVKLSRYLSLMQLGERPQSPPRPVAERTISAEKTNPTATGISAFWVGDRGGLKDGMMRQQLVLATNNAPSNAGSPAHEVSV
ncbi:MAG: hypothetical protein SFZ03_01985 [Candidatus Melainabacteria bacterium]|nr:hypothetical protein [Candidatus Melainabacteria bacterium]